MTEADTNFNDVLVDIDGEEMPMRTGGTDELPEVKTMALGDVCVRALVNTQEGDSKLEGSKKLEYFTLAQKIRGNGSGFAICRLTSDEKVLIKKRANNLWPITVYARIHEAFEGEAE